MVFLSLRKRKQKVRFVSELKILKHVGSIATYPAVIMRHNPQFALYRRRVYKDHYMHLQIPLMHCNAPTGFFSCIVEVAYVSNTKLP